MPIVSVPAVLFDPPPRGRLSRSNAAKALRAASGSSSLAVRNVSTSGILADPSTNGVAINKPLTRPVAPFLPSSSPSSPPPPHTLDQIDLVSETDQGSSPIAGPSRERTVLGRSKKTHSTSHRERAMSPVILVDSSSPCRIEQSTQRQIYPENGGRSSRNPAWASAAVTVSDSCTSDDSDTDSVQVVD